MDGLYGNNEIIRKGIVTFLRSGGGLVFPVPWQVRDGNRELDVYFVCFALCGDGICKVQRHDRRAVCVGVDKIRVHYAEEASVCAIRKIVADNLDSEFIIQNRVKFLIKRKQFENFLEELTAI